MGWEKNLYLGENATYHISLLEMSGRPRPTCERTDDPIYSFEIFSENFFRFSLIFADTVLGSFKVAIIFPIIFSVISTVYIRKIMNFINIWAF